MSESRENERQPGDQYQPSNQVDRLLTSPVGVQHSDQNDAYDEDRDSFLAADVSDDYISGARLWSVMAALTFCSFLVMLDMAIIATVSICITKKEEHVTHQKPRQFHRSQRHFMHLQMLAGSEVHISWPGLQSPGLLSSHTFQELSTDDPYSSAVQPLTGKLYLRFKVKTTFLAFLGLFELGSLICGGALSSRMFILGRAVSGLGTSGLLNGALTIIAAAVPMQQRPALIGVVMLSKSSS